MIVLTEVWVLVAPACVLDLQAKKERNSCSGRRCREVAPCDEALASPNLLLGSERSNCVAPELRGQCVLQIARFHKVTLTRMDKSLELGMQRSRSVLAALGPQADTAGTRESTSFRVREDPTKFKNIADTIEKIPTRNIAANVSSLQFSKGGSLFRSKDASGMFYVGYAAYYCLNCS